AGRVLVATTNAGMVPLMAVTLLVVVASQLPKVGHELQQVAPVVPLYLAFLLIMGVVGGVLARAFRLDTGRSRALVFSGVTRNSLVVLPVALSLPEVYAITLVVVV